MLDSPPAYLRRGGDRGRDSPRSRLVARQATGSLRDALSLLDQLRVFAEGAITLPVVQEMLGAGGSEEVAAFVDTLIAGDLAEGLHGLTARWKRGFDLRQFNRQIVEHLRGLMLVKTGAAQANVRAVGRHRRNSLAPAEAGRGRSIPPTPALDQDLWGG